MQSIDHIIPKVEDWPIASFHRDRERIVKKLISTTMDALLTDPELPSYLNQTVYNEKLRCKSNPLKVDPPNEYAYWKKVETDLSKAVEEGADSGKIHEEILQKIVSRYAEEILGDFKPKTFKFVRKLTTWVFKLLLNPFKRKGQGFFWGDKSDVLGQIKIEGPIEDIRALFDKGTVLVLPTHFSNLDSLTVGYAIDMLAGLPFFSYGAGLNLYDYEVFAYYMSRIGTYKIDRRKRNPIYRKTLDLFSTVGIQEGLNSIFYPGGTRSRTGAIEQKLKFGLMNTIIDSQNEFYVKGIDRKIIIVPLVTSYHFVLESNGLIDQYLRKTGKENYFDRITKKNVSMKRFRFLKRLFGRGSEMVMSFGQPIDIFGHKIDKDGRSIKDGRTIEISDYFRSGDKLTKDVQRNRVYSRYLADAVVDSYMRENVVLSSHVATFVVYQMFEKQYPNLDLYALLALPEEYLDLPIDQVCTQIEKVQVRLRELSDIGQVKLSEVVRSCTAEQVISDGIEHINSYHFYQPIKLKNGAVQSENLKLLYFYSNRLFGYKLDRIITVGQKKNIILRKALY